MKNFFIIFLLFVFIQGKVFAKSKYFQEGVDLFNKNEFEMQKLNSNKILFLIQK